MSDLKTNVNKKVDINYSLNIELSNKLEELANGSQELLYIILVSALVKVIADYKNTNQVRIGICKNTVLPVSISLSDDTNFKDILLYIRKIINESDIEEHKLIDFTEFTIIHKQVHGWDSYNNKFITVSQENETISLTWSTYIDKDEIESLQNVLEIVLNQAVEALDMPLNEYVLIEPAQLNRYLIDWQGEKKPAITDKHVIELIYEAAEKYPNNIAVATAEESITYQEFITGIEKAASFFDELGIYPQEKVAIIANKSIEAIVAIYGLLRIGASYVPIENDYPDERKKYIIDNCACKCVFNTFSTSKISNCDINQIYLKKGWYSNYACPYHGKFPNSNSIVYTMYTSGTTGYPKGVSIYNPCLINLCTWFIRVTAISSEDKVVLLIPYCFDASVKNIFSPLIAGATLVLGPELLFDTYTVIKLIKSRGVTHINCVPRLFYALMDTALEELEQNFNTVKYAVMGGESLESKPLLPWAKSSLNIRVLNVYGPTECTSVSTFAEIEKKTVLNNDIIPIGNPIDNKLVYVINRNNILGPSYFQGELFLSGIGTVSKYLEHKDPSVHTAFQNNRFCEGEVMYKTGDIVKWDGNGQLIYLGRIDKQVKIQGHRVELLEIEEALKRHELIKEAIVLYNSSESNDILAAFIIGTEEKVDVESINSYVETILPDYMVPNKYISLKSYPVNSNGKIDNEELINMINLHDRPEINKQLQVKDTRSLIHDIWRELLKTDNIGYNVNFFDAGGYSLLLYKLNKALIKTFDVTISFIDLMTFTTINALTERIKQLKKSSETSSDSGIQKFDRLSAVKNRAKEGGKW